MLTDDNSSIIMYTTEDGDGELDRNSVVANFATTASDENTYQVDYYNLDVIISVGYRVKSLRGTQFHIWTMGILKEYMKKGFALDDDRLKRLGGGNYFDELLPISEISVPQKKFSGEKYWKSTQQA